MIPLHILRNLRILFLFFIVSLLMGCSGGLFGQKIEEPKGNGFHTVLPKHGTHVVIWGEHSTAIAQASAWLQKQGAIIIDDSRLQQAFKKHHIHPNGTPSDRARLLKAGSLIGSDLVVFLDVKKLLLVQEGNFVQAGSTPNQVYDLEVEGVDVQTGETVWQGHAKDSAPTQQSEVLVRNLTTYALERAWSSPQASTKSFDLVRADKSPSESTPPSLPAEHRSEIKTNNAEKYGPTKLLSLSNSKTMPEARSQEHQSAITKQVPTLTDTIDNKTENNFNSLAKQHNTWEPEMQNSSQAQDDDIGLQIASGGLSLLYCPAKLIYAGVGSVIGGFAYLLSGGDEQVADSIWFASLQGTYLIRPSHLRGEEPVHFMGTSQEEFATIDSPSNSLFAKDSIP